MIVTRIYKNDTVAIRAQGTTRTVIVETAINYGTDAKPNWYIEGNDKSHGAVYWKQKIDGGEITSVIPAWAADVTVVALPFTAKLLVDLRDERRYEDNRVLVPAGTFVVVTERDGDDLFFEFDGRTFSAPADDLEVA